jgi:hypothetical protein
LSIHLSIHPLTHLISSILLPSGRHSSHTFISLLKVDYLFFFFQTLYWAFMNTYT